MAAPRSPRDSALITGAAQSGARHAAPYRQADCPTRAWNRGGVAGTERGGASPGAGLWERGAALRGPRPGGRAWERSRLPAGCGGPGCPAPRRPPRGWGAPGAGPLCQGTLSGRGAGQQPCPAPPRPALPAAPSLLALIG